MPDDRQPPAEPMTWSALRDAGAAVQLAVQMLAGPLAPWNDPPPDPARLRDVFATLERSTRRVNALIAALQPAAVPMASRPSIALGEPICDRSAAGFAEPTAAVLRTEPPDVNPPGTGVATAMLAPMLAPRTASHGEPSQGRGHASTRVPGGTRRGVAPPRAPSAEKAEPCAHVRALLREVEIELLTGPGSPRVSIHAADDLFAAGDATVLGAAIVGLLVDAAAMGPADAVVEVRAFADLADALGDDMDIVFEIRPDPRVPGGRDFRPTTSGLPEGIRLEVHGQGRRPRACIRVAATRPARILAA